MVQKQSNKDVSLVSRRALLPDNTKPNDIQNTRTDKNSAVIIVFTPEKTENF